MRMWLYYTWVWFSGTLIGYLAYRLHIERKRNVELDRRWRNHWGPRLTSGVMERWDDDLGEWIEVKGGDTTR